jgi:hypothetical protein
MGILAGRVDAHLYHSVICRATGAAPAAPDRHEKHFRFAVPRRGMPQSVIGVLQKKRRELIGWLAWARFERFPDPKPRKHFPPLLARSAAAASGKVFNVAVEQPVERTMSLTRIGTHEHLEEFVGTREELLAHGLIQQGQLPGSPGLPSLSATFYGGALVRKGSRKPKDEHYVRVQRLGNGRYLVARGLSAAQREERQARADALFELERARLEADEALRAVPESVAGFRERCIAELKGHMAYLRLSRLDANEYGALRCGGYRYDQETLEAFDDAVAELLSVLRSGAIRFDAGKHAEVRASIQVRVAKADLPLQELLATSLRTVVLHRAEKGALK